MSLALAWGVEPDWFFNQPDEIIETAFSILEERNSG